MHAITFGWLILYLQHLIGVFWLLPNFAFSCLICSRHFYHLDNSMHLTSLKCQCMVVSGIRVLVKKLTAILLLSFICEEISTPLHNWQKRAFRYCWRDFLHLSLPTFTRYEGFKISKKFTVCAMLSAELQLYTFI